MANFIEFKGLKHYPMGDATLAIVNEKLVISNIGDSGLDGVSIRTVGNSEWNASIERVEMQPNQSLTVTNLGKDGYGRIKVLGQQSTFYDSESGQFKQAFNSKLLSKKVTLIGQINGSTSYEGQFYIPENDPCINWIWVVVSVVTWVLGNIDYKNTTTTSTTTNSDGTTSSTSETSTEWSFGGAMPTNPKGNTFKSFEGYEFAADHMIMKSRFNYCGVLPDILVNRIQEVQIMGRNFGTLTIENEFYR